MARSTMACNADGTSTCSNGLLNCSLASYMQHFLMSGPPEELESGGTQRLFSKKLRAAKAAHLSSAQHKHLSRDRRRDLEVLLRLEVIPHALTSGNVSIKSKAASHHGNLCEN